MRIIESWLMVERIEDWSAVRSPARARRRLKRGFPQRIVLREVPKKEAISLDGGITYYVHPLAAKALREAIPMGSVSTPEVKP